MKVHSNIIDYTVTQLNKSIKNIIESSFLTLRVVGEVSQVKKHSSGHIYFTLKDQESSLSAICWRSNVNKLNVKIEEGSSVVIIGRITTYSILLAEGSATRKPVPADTAPRRSLSLNSKST